MRHQTHNVLAFVVVSLLLGAGSTAHAVSPKAGCLPSDAAASPGTSSEAAARRFLADNAARFRMGAEQGVTAANSSYRPGVFVSITPSIDREAPLRNALLAVKASDAGEQAADLVVYPVAASCLLAWRVLQHHFLIPANASCNTAANALVTAATNVGFTGTEIAAIGSVLQNRGFTVTV